MCTVFFLKTYVNIINAGVKAETPPRCTETLPSAARHGLLLLKAFHRSESSIEVFPLGSFNDGLAMSHMQTSAEESKN